MRANGVAIFGNCVLNLSYASIYALAIQTHGENPCAPCMLAETCVIGLNCCEKT